MVTNPMMLFAAQFGTRSKSRAEADVHSAIAGFLTVAQLGLQQQHVVKLEDPVQDGTRRRIDVSYGRVLIEVKRDISVAQVLTKAEPQLAGYMQARSDATGDVYAGIITDGVVWRLYALHGDGLECADEFRLARPDSDSVERLQVWLHAILLTGPKLLATKRRIEERLGAKSPRYKFDRARLEKLYQENRDDPALVLKKELWARLLRTALGTSFTEDESLFIDHTMLVIEAEIIAHLVVGLDPATLTPKQVISGSQFHEAGITNVVESDFFDWPAEVPGGGELVQDLVREISHLDWSAVEHDLLKTLYEAIISADVRKALGEYYTSDWLAKTIVDKQVDDPLVQRVADVSCGSGTFVFHAVRRFLDAAQAAGMPNADSIELLQDRVFGMDIHPVSVVLARVTYLLAIGAERLKDRGTLTVPIFLGDSIQWGRRAHAVDSGTITVPVDAEDLASVDTESFDTLVSFGQELAIPVSAIQNPGALDSLIGALADRAQTHVDSAKPYPKIGSLLDQHGVTDKSDRTVLEATFRTLCDLNADGRDHIWGYYLRNQLRPIWLSLPEHKLDRLVGNPPWLSYRFMSASMQSQFRIMSTARGLWEGGKVATHQDLVALFIARSVEQFLKVDGTFAFVTPFAVLSRMHYAGFRTGEWLKRGTSTVTARFEEPWDLSDVKPALFPVPSAVVFGAHSVSDPAPLPDIARHITKQQDELVQVRVRYHQLTDEDAMISPYGNLPIQGANLVPRVLLLVNPVPPGPLGQPAGTTTVESLRSPQEKKPWKFVEAVAGPVESEFVKVVLVGTSITPFRIEWPAKAVLPIANGKLLKPAERRLRPLLQKRWDEIAAVWETHRASDKLSIDDQVDWQGKLRRQLPAPKYRVLYTKSGKRMCAAVCTNPDAVIDHTLYWLPAGSLAEAHYVTAILNSDTLAGRMSALQSKGLFGARHFDMLPWRMPIARFDGDDEAHSEIADLGSQAQGIAAAVTLDHVATFSEGRNLVRQALIDEGIAHRLEAAVASLLGEEVIEELEPLLS